MTSIERAKEISKQYREFKKEDAHVIVNGKALYKPEFVIFVIERMEANTFFNLQSTLEEARNAVITKYSVNIPVV